MSNPSEQSKKPSLKHVSLWITLLVMISGWGAFVALYEDPYNDPCKSGCATETNIDTRLQSLEERFLAGDIEVGDDDHTLSQSDASRVVLATFSIPTVHEVLTLIARSQIATVSRTFLTGLPHAQIPTDIDTQIGELDGWNLVQLVIPTDARSMIDEYREETDGPSRTLAYVEPTDRMGAQWALIVDPADAYNDARAFTDFDKLLITLVHEFGHALTLNNTQVFHTRNTSKCTEGAYIIYEGCVLPDSYLQAFVDQYWSDLMPEFMSLDRNDRLVLAGFYSRHPERFINRYAATNPEEDIAETWAAYVLTQRGENPQTAIDKKIAFFSQYPELVELRTSMRERLAYVLEAYEDKI